MSNFNIKANWFKIHDAIRYFIIGSMNAGISYLIFAIAILILGEPNHQICIALQWGLSSFISYFNQKFLVFNTRGNYIKEYTKCCATWFAGYLLNAFLIEIFLKYTPVNIYVSEAIAMLSAAVFTYVIFKICVFKK